LSASREKGTEIPLRLSWYEISAVRPDTTGLLCALHKIRPMEALPILPVQLRFGQHSYLRSYGMVAAGPGVPGV